MSKPPSWPRSWAMFTWQNYRKRQDQKLETNIEMAWKTPQFHFRYKISIDTRKQIWEQSRRSKGQKKYQNWPPFEICPWSEWPKFRSGSIKFLIFCFNTFISPKPPSIFLSYTKAYPCGNFLAWNSQILHLPAVSSLLCGIRVMELRPFVEAESEGGGKVKKSSVQVQLARCNLFFLVKRLLNNEILKIFTIYIDHRIL